MNSILSIKNVEKRYHNHVALNSVSLELQQGALFGLLGPNGAGKTSLIRIITAITRADEGEVLFDGSPLDETKTKHIGYMPEERGLYKKMKVKDQLLYFAQLRGMPRNVALDQIKMWFDRLDIGNWYNKTVDELSKGMQQKIQFVATVLHQPSLLILDEPFTGLDPINANILKDEIYRLHQNGTTIIFSTHRMEQVEEICTEIALINKGNIILEGNVHTIKQQFKENLFEVKYKGSLDNAPECGEGFELVNQKDHLLTLRSNGKSSSNKLLLNLIHHGIEIEEYREILPSLNDIFIKQVEKSNFE